MDHDSILGAAIYYMTATLVFIAFSPLSWYVVYRIWATDRAQKRAMEKQA